MSNSLDQRSIIVTGAGRGIGASIARGLAAQGARLTIADIDADTAGIDVGDGQTSMPTPPARSHERSATRAAKPSPPRWT